MPANLISATAFICERTLIEKDDVMSAIRLVDLFYVTEFQIQEGKPVPPQPIPGRSIGQAFVSMFLVIILKAQPGDQSSHSLILRITNPAGEEKNVDDVPVQANFTSKLPDVSGGFTLVAQLNVQPKLMGSYNVRVLLDGEEVCRAPFSILKHPTVEESVH
jgi:hypothetical protein